MNGKKIGKIISEALLESLQKFPEAVETSTRVYAGKTNIERRMSYNEHLVSCAKKNIDPLLIGGDNKIGMCIEVYDPKLNCMLKEDDPDAPAINIYFNNKDSAYLDPKTMAKVILFGLSSDFVYPVNWPDGSRKEYVIDKVEYGRWNFDYLTVRFKQL